MQEKENSTKFINIGSYLRICIILFVLLIIQIPTPFEKINKEVVYVILSLGLVYSIISRLLPHTIKEQPAFLFFIFTIDIMLITLLIQYSGKIDSSFYPLYLLSLIHLAVYLDVKTVFIGLLLVSMLYLLMMLPEYKSFLLGEYNYGVILYLPIFWFLTSITCLLSRSARTYENEASGRGLFIKFIKKQHLEEVSFEEFINNIFILTDEGKLFDYVVDRLKIFFGAEVVILLKDEEIGLVGYKGSRLSEAKLERFVIVKDDQIYVRLADKKEQIFIYDEERIPSYLGKFFMKSIMISPLLAEDKLLGAVCVYMQEEVREFSKDEQLLLYKLGIYISQAYNKILKAKFLDVSLKKLDNLKGLSRSMAEFCELYFIDREALLDKVDYYIKDVFGISRYRIMLIEKSSQELYVIKSCGLSEVDNKVRINLGEGMVGEVAMTGKEVCALEDNWKAELISSDVDSLCILPLRVHDNIFGVIDLIDLKPKEIINIEKYLFLKIFVSIFAKELYPYYLSMQNNALPKFSIL